MNVALVTGASGLLGSELVKQLVDNDFFVYGQYYNNKPSNLDRVKWIYGDFTNLTSLRKFIEENKNNIAKSSYFINCYGPITYKNIKSLETEDFENDFFSNVLVPVEITNFLLHIKNPVIKSVINIGFELSGKFVPVSNVLSYLMAKNALYEYSISLAKAYPKINFNMVSLPTLVGANVPSKTGKVTTPKNVAKSIIKLF